LVVSIIVSMMHGHTNNKYIEYSPAWTSRVLQRLGEGKGDFILNSYEHHQ